MPCHDTDTKLFPLVSQQLPEEPSTPLVTSAPTKGPEMLYRLPGQPPVVAGDPRTLTLRLLEQRAALLEAAGFHAAALEPDFVVVLGGHVLRTCGYPPW